MRIKVYFSVGCLQLFLPTYVRFNGTTSRKAFVTQYMQKVNGNLLFLMFCTLLHECVCACVRERNRFPSAQLMVIMILASTIE